MTPPQIKPDAVVIDGGTQLRYDYRTVSRKTRRGVEGQTCKELGIYDMCTTPPEAQRQCVRRISWFRIRT
jgi:hypothetical protein